MPMTLPEPGQPILLNVAGRSLELRFSLKTLRGLAADGVSVLKGGGAEAFQDPEKLGLMLFHGLREKQPDLTREWVEDNFDASMIMPLAPLLVYATTGHRGAAGASPNGAGLNGAVGSTSGLSPDTISASASPTPGV
jgi:hypothetical protein